MGTRSYNAISLREAWMPLLLPCRADGAEAVAHRPEVRQRHADACGVSLRLVRRIMADVADRLGSRAKLVTTTDVVEKYVKPRTAASRQRFVDWLQGNGHADEADVGMPMYFVSHAWGRPFEETMNMVGFRCFFGFQIE